MPSINTKRGCHCADIPGASLHTRSSAKCLTSEQDSFVTALLADKQISKAARRQLKALLQSALRCAAILIRPGVVSIAPKVCRSFINLT